MNTSIDSLLTAYRGTAIPALPGSFTDDVLRAIRLRKSETTSTRHWCQDFLETVLRPSVLVTGVSVAIAVGGFVTYSTHPAETGLAVRGLDLGIFSSYASGLPSGRLSRVP